MFNAITESADNVLFVFRSMYFDEDGDLAHEFYHEVRVTGPSGVVRRRMEQIFDRLIPQVGTQYCACIL